MPLSCSDSWGALAGVDFAAKTSDLEDMRSQLLKLFEDLRIC